MRDDGPVIRIGRAVLSGARPRDHSAPEEYFKRFSEYKLEENSSALQFEFSSNSGVNQPHLLIDLSWKDISEIIDAAIKRGEKHNDELSGLTFLE